ncbi:hypothetical protein GTW51_01610 [Aurantimonas aggregata]|uniref:Uncharacterized protein n=1 Tax=Aurantimonas aggregata TaxID=2047720 RepID=A0A6L9MCZ3_9HYPH|nr:hypothetical protein [Aurantimonas aggregata]NDV85392.1 hypothetical protein [Aurantimonas aggregata]
MSPVQRADFYERLKAWAAEPINGVYLDDSEVASLEAFLGTLSFEAESNVAETD